MARKVLFWVGCAIIAIGSLLPWAKLGILEAAGTDGDGVITLVIAVIAVGVPFLWSFNRWAGCLLGLLLGAMVMLIAIYDMNSISSGETELLGESISPEIGEGLYLTLLGGIWIAVIAGIQLILSEKKGSAKEVGLMKE